MRRRWTAPRIGGYRAKATDVQRDPTRLPPGRGSVSSADGPCGGCQRPATTVVVSVNDWIIDVCDDCARALCDPCWT